MTRSYFMIRSFLPFNPLPAIPTYKHSCLSSGCHSWSEMGVITIERNGLRRFLNQLSSAYYPFAFVSELAA
jgi:hypothetical protein